MERRQQITADKQQTAQDAYEKTKYKKLKLEEAGYTVTECWEHELKQQIMEDNKMKIFFDTISINKPIDPRSCLYGGRTEVMKMLHECQPGERIDYIDVCR